jgi:hypothetical protein
MPDLGRWFGMDKLSESYLSTSPYAYVMNNPISFFDPDGRYTQGSGDNWLQDMWNNTTSYSSWSNTGNGSFSGGEIGMPHDQFTSFYNFLSGGGTGSYTYWTNAAGNSTGSRIQGLDGHKVNITDNGWMSDMINKAAGFMDSIWNSDFARNYVSDSYSIGLSSNVAAFAGVGTTPINFTLLTRGKEPGLYFTPTVNASLGDGIEGNAGVAFGSGTYTGNPRSITSSMLQGNSYGVSVGLGLAIDASVGASYAPTGQGNGFINTSGQVGVGIEGSPATVVNIQGTYQYTPIVKPIFQFK